MLNTILSNELVNLTISFTTNPAVLCTDTIFPATIVAVPSPDPTPVAVNRTPIVLDAAPIAIKLVGVISPSVLIS